MSLAEHRGSTGLVVRGLRSGYFGDAVIFDVDFDAPFGSVTAIFGHNGAGKTTILRTVAGLLELQAGSVMVGDTDLAGSSAREMIRSGVVYLPEDRATFPGLSVVENLEMGAIANRKAVDLNARMRNVFALFPLLADRRKSLARTLSGGQQRMLSVGMALMADARVLLLDEPSLGLAPALNQGLLAQVSAIAREDGRADVLVEQAVGQALPVVDYVYVVRAGRVISEMDGDAARTRGDWRDVY